MYKVFFTDETSYLGGPFANSKWNSIPDKPIKELVYIIGQTQFRFRGYTEYNHIVERVNVAGQEFISQVIIMGRNSNVVDCIVIDLKTQKAQRVQRELGHEYNNRATTGWKVGVNMEVPRLLVGGNYGL